MVHKNCFECGVGHGRWLMVAGGWGRSRRLASLGGAEWYRHRMQFCKQSSSAHSSRATARRNSSQNWWKTRTNEDGRPVCAHSKQDNRTDVSMRPSSANEYPVVHPKHPHPTLSDSLTLHYTTVDVPFYDVIFAAFLPPNWNLQLSAKSQDLHNCLMPSFLGAFRERQLSELTSCNIFCHFF